VLQIFGDAVNFSEIQRVAAADQKKIDQNGSDQAPHPGDKTGNASQGLQGRHPVGNWRLSPWGAALTLFGRAKTRSFR
jgi:hypothetical protein